VPDRSFAWLLLCWCFFCASSFVALSDVNAHGRDIPPGKQTVGCSECTLFLHGTLIFLLTLFSDFNADHLEHVLPLGAFGLFVKERPGIIPNKQ
jgi:hypothetical protein